ncbi:hypothetical protein MKCMC460_33140 [Mycobacterium sp. 20KCMC460]|nr:hypothetical protein MKCMC460_33140 [Mycobacterium sp. 20KCMC460]
MAGGTVMKTLRENVTDYLATRRALGFKLEGLSKLLWSFVEFCEQRGATRVHNDLAVQWATTPIKVPVSDALIARRLDAVRIFARYQHALDPLTQIPAEEHRPRRYRPKPPNILSQNDICALLAATGILEPAFKALTWRTMIGLLAATGLRPGEACRLAVSDVNLAGGVIQVLETKFGKSRLVFIHPSTATVIADYLQARQAWVGPAHTAAQRFSSTPGAHRYLRTGSMPPSVRSSRPPGWPPRRGTGQSACTICATPSR